MKQTRTPLPVSVLIVCGFLLMAIVSIAYHYSVGFSGDMYELGAFFQMRRIGKLTILLILGAILFVSALMKKSKGLRRAGTVLVIVVSVVLLQMALNTLRSRTQWEIRKNYPNRNVEELLHIARHGDAEEAQLAIDALLIKKDPAAVPGLCEILFDETEMMHLRTGAAHALGDIGGQEAREALEKVRTSNLPEELMNAAKDALEVRMGLPKVPQNSKPDEPPTEPIDSPAKTIP